MIEVVISKDNKVKKDAFVIRKTVFTDEQGFFDELDSIDDNAWHAAVYDDDKIIGCGRMFLEDEKKYHVGRIAVLKEYRGTGVGRRIMNALESKARSEGASAVVLSAQRRARDFYVTLGYETVGDEYLEEGYPHTFMKKYL